MPEEQKQNHETQNIELLKLELERARYRSEIMKWIVVAVGAAISFAVIDYGKLRLEQARLASDNQLRFIDAYSKATEAAEPEVWKRKLDVLRLFAADEKVKAWAEGQLKYIDEFAALDALYSEAAKSASQLVDPATVNEPERMKARRRYEQLYWADLPFAGESSEVADAMVDFRRALVIAEATPNDVQGWKSLNQDLIRLSQTLKGATRKSSKLINAGKP